MSQHLTTFVESFIAKRYKRQWLAILERTKPNSEVFRGMDNLYRELDERHCTELPKGNKQQNISFVKQAIAPYKITRCWVLSAHEHFNEQSIPVEEALQKIVGTSSTTLISFLPGKVAYFEGHSVDERYLCIKRV
jgi:hypothetical protein